MDLSATFSGGAAGRTRVLDLARPLARRIILRCFALEFTSVEQLLQQAAAMLRNLGTAAARTGSFLQAGLQSLSTVAPVRAERTAASHTSSGGGRTTTALHPQLTHTLLVDSWSVAAGVPRTSTASKRDHCRGWTPRWPAE